MTVAKELFKCKDKKHVEAVFKKHKVNSLEEKIKELNGCMGNPMTFYSYGKELDLEKKYALELQIFLLGEWRIIELYEKLGY
jgi:hypothetical protein